jgi:hypothetical protein
MVRFARTVVFFTVSLVVTATLHAQLPARYTLSINIRSDADSFTTYDVVLSSGKSRTKLRGFDVDKYSLISFNRPKDLLWAGCADGYRLLTRTTTTASSILTQDASDPEHAPAGIEFNERRAGTLHNLTIRCAR